MQCAVAGIGVWSPLVPGWDALCALARGEPLPQAQQALPPASLLPPAERRRATLSTRIVLTVAQEALAASRWNAADIATVFASSSGSPDITDTLCAMLAAGDTQISPTRFHNSVHNAAAGYYSIAVECRAASTSIAAFDASAAAGLLEAAVLVATEQRPVLFVSFDSPYTGALARQRTLGQAWGVALALMPRDAAPAPMLDIGWRADQDNGETRCASAQLDALRLGNPTARLLPLLFALAGSAPPQVRLDAPLGAQLRIEVRR